MSERPDKWMPWFIGDFDRATGHLNDTENLAYRRLLEWHWGNGPLPDDDARLASIVRKPLAIWRKLRPALVGFFTVADGRWTQKRAEAEWERALKGYRQRLEASRKGVEVRRRLKKGQDCGDRPVNRTVNRSVVPDVQPTTTTKRKDALSEQIFPLREAPDARSDGDRGLALVARDGEVLMDREELAAEMAKLAGTLRRVAPDG